MWSNISHHAPYVRRPFREMLGAGVKVEDRFGQPSPLGSSAPPFPAARAMLVAMHRAWLCPKKHPTQFVISVLNSCDYCCDHSHSYACGSIMHKTDWFYRNQISDILSSEQCMMKN